MAQPQAVRGPVAGPTLMPARSSARAPRTHRCLAPAPPHQPPTSAPPMRRTPQMAVMRQTRRRLAGATTAALVLGLAAALPASAAAPEPEGRIQYAGAPGAIKDSYIVTLKEDVAKAESADGKALAASYGATIAHTYT